MVSCVALLVCRVVMWNRKTMVYGRGGKLLWYFFANVLMRLCGLISGLLYFLQFIVCGFWCLYAFVEPRISCVFSLWVLSICDMFCDTFCDTFCLFLLCFSVRFMWDVYVKCGLDVCLTYEQVV